MSEQAWFVEAKLDFQEFSAGGIRTFAVVEGKADSFPVIFLHGIPGNCFVWSQILQTLGRKRLAVAPDLPGIGRSKNKFSEKNPDLTPEFSLKWLEGVLQAQNIERFDLVAQGFGCWIGLELLLQNPTRIRRICLINPQFWKEGLSDSFFKKLSDKFASKPNLPMIKPEWQPLADDGVSKSLARWSGEFSTRFANYLEQLKKYSGSLLLIWGKQDIRFQAERVQNFIESLPQAEVYQFENGGQFVMLEQAEEINRILKEFLE